MKKGVSNSYLWGYGAPKGPIDKSGSGGPARNNVSKAGKSKKKPPNKMPSLNRLVKAPKSRGMAK